MSLAAELLLAQLGVDDILAKKPIVVRPAQVDRIDTDAKALERKTNAFVTADTWTKYQYVKPKWAYKDVLDAINNPATAQHFAEAEGVPDSLRVPFQEAATNVLRVLQKEIPLQSTTRAFGVDVREPSDSMWAAFCRILSLANDPGLILTLMSAGSLLPTEAQGLREMYPAIFEFIGGAMLHKVVEIKARNPEYRMDWRRELICSRYANSPGFDQELAGRLQKTFADQKQAQQAPKESGPRASKRAESMRTQTQRTSES